MLPYFDDETGLIYIFGRNSTKSFVFDLAKLSMCRYDSSVVVDYNHLAFKERNNYITVVYTDRSNPELLSFHRIKTATNQNMPVTIKTIPLSITGNSSLKYGKYLHITYQCSTTATVYGYFDKSSFATSIGVLPKKSRMGTIRLPLPYRFRVVEIEIIGVNILGSFMLQELGFELKSGRPE